MGLLDKLLVGGGVAAIGVAARSLYKDAQETQRRKNSPLSFDDGFSQEEFVEIATGVARRTPRVAEVSVSGMTVSLRVKSNSGLSTWKAEIDFNDYGHLTGRYWLTTENSDSLIPRHFAENLQVQLGRRASQSR